MSWLRLLVLFGQSFPDLYRSRASLQAERVVLRQQLAILKEQQPRRIRLQPVDRTFWALMSKLWSEWRDALVIAEPDTVLRWRREGFRLVWRRRRQSAGRPPLAKAHQELIRWISANSVLWGAPRVHGEIRKLGINVSQTTVAKYMEPRTKRPSQSWRAFLRNHARELVLSGEFNDQGDDLQGCCSWPGSTGDEILTANLFDSSCAKSSSRQPVKSIERDAGIVLFPGRAGVREEARCESCGPPPRRAKSPKHEMRLPPSPFAFGAAGSRSAPLFSRSRKKQDAQLAVVVRSLFARDGSLRSVA